MPTIILRNGVNGYSGCKNAYLDYSNPTTKGGVYPRIFVKRVGEDISLLKFDLNDIPSNITVNSAFLSLEHSASWGGNNSLTIYVKEVNKDWVEIDVDFLTTDGATPWGTDASVDATNSYFNSLPVYSSTIIQLEKKWYNFNVTNIVQKALNNQTSPSGFLNIALTRNDDFSDSKVFWGRKYYIPSRPTLTIIYDEVIPGEVEPILEEPAVIAPPEEEAIVVFPTEPAPIMPISPIVYIPTPAPIQPIEVPTEYVPKITSLEMVIGIISIPIIIMGVYLFYLLRKR